MNNIQTTKVYTPSSVKTFVERTTKINNHLVDALKTLGKQIILNGHTKCGKTTLIVNKTNRLTFLKKAIVEDLETEKGGHFPNLLPYIQLHEFEALVFSTLDAIKALYSIENAKFKELEQIATSYPNPENINESPKTAPSKRMKDDQLNRGYNKVNVGIVIIEEASVDIISLKC